MAIVDTKWVASLSDGSTAIEGVEPFDEVSGGISAWQQLKQHIFDNNLHITGMRIQATKLGHPTYTYNLPSLGSSNLRANGKHRKFRHIKPTQPISYDYFRYIETDMYQKYKEERYIEIRAIYEDFTVSLFVDETEGSESWVAIHDNLKL